MVLEKAKEFEAFVQGTLRPDYLKAIELREKLLDEHGQYEILLLTLQKIEKSNSKSLSTLVNLGHHVFVNAEIKDCNKIIVKMLEDIYVELPLKNAANFIEKKMKILFDRAEHAALMASRIKAHMDLILASLEELYIAEEKTIK